MKTTDPKYLDWLKTQRCVLTGHAATEYDAVDPAHIGTYGKGLKTDDEALPLLHSLHARGHNGGEIKLFREHAPNWLIRDALRAYARERYREWLESGDWTGGKFR